MSQLSDRVVSTNEAQFVVAALKDSIRTDGRGLESTRRTKIAFEEQWGVSRVTIGNTQVITTVTANVVEPSPDRGTEGVLYFNVEFPPIGSPYFTNNQKTAQGVEISRIIERCIKDTKCVDMETLVIIAKERVWSINVNIRVINYDGNIIDACTLSSLASLLYFRRPDVNVTAEGVVIYNEIEKNFLPLQVSCIPITTTFALYNHAKSVGTRGQEKPLLCVVDPSLIEDCTCDGLMTIAATPDQEILCINATGANGYPVEQVLTNSTTAVTRAKALYQILKHELDATLKQRTHQIWGEGQKIPKKLGQ